MKIFPRQLAGLTTMYVCMFEERSALAAMPMEKGRADWAKERGRYADLFSQLGHSTSTLQYWQQNL